MNEFLIKVRESMLLLWFACVSTMVGATDVNEFTYSQDAPIEFKVDTNSIPTYQEYIAELKARLDSMIPGLSSEEVESAWKEIGLQAAEWLANHSGNDETKDLAHDILKDGQYSKKEHQRLLRHLVDVESFLDVVSAIIHDYYMFNPLIIQKIH